MSQLIFSFNNSLQIKFKHSPLLVTLSSFKKQRPLLYNLTNVNPLYFKENKIVSNNFKAQAAYHTYNVKINAYAVNFQLKNFLKNYKYEKLIKNFKDFNNYNNKKLEKTKRENSLFIKKNSQILFPNIRQQKLNKKIDSLRIFLPESTNTNHSIDSFYVLKQAACYARLLKCYQFFSKQTCVFPSPSNFIFLKKNTQLNTQHVLQNRYKTQIVAYPQRVTKHNFRTYSYLQTLLAKYLETTLSTKNTLDHQSNCTTYTEGNKTFLQKQAFNNHMITSTTPFPLGDQAVFLTNISTITPKKFFKNQQVTNTDQHFLFNKINNKSFLSYWLIPITGFALMTSNIFYNTKISPINSYFNHVLYLKTLPTNKVQTSNVVCPLREPQKILFCKTKLTGITNFNTTDLKLFKSDAFLPFSYQYSQSLIIKKTFDNLYGFIKAKTTVSKTTNIIPFREKIVGLSSLSNNPLGKTTGNNFSHNIVRTNVNMLQVMPNFKQTKTIKKVNNHVQFSNNLIPLNMLQSLNNNVKWFYKNYIFKKNIPEYNQIKLESFIKPFFIYNCHDMFQNHGVPVYSDKLKTFFGITNIFTHLKNSESYFKNMLYLSAINPLYSNIKLNNNVSFIKDKKTLKLLKSKIFKITNTKKKIKHIFAFLKEKTNKSRLFFNFLEKDKVEYVFPVVSLKAFPEREDYHNKFLFDIYGKNISKLYKTTNTNKNISKSKPVDSYKESLNLININLKHKNSLIYCKNILQKYNKLYKLKFILKLSNIKNKNQIIFNFFLFNNKNFNTKKLLKLNLNLIKTRINFSKNKTNNDLTSYYLNYKLTKPILLSVFPNLKMVSTRFEYRQNVANKVETVNNKILQTGKLWVFPYGEKTKLGFKNNIYYTTKPFKINQVPSGESSVKIQQRFSTSLAFTQREPTYFLRKPLVRNLPNYNISSLSVLLKHQKMLAPKGNTNKPEIEKQRLQIQKKRKAKKQRLETRRQKKRTRFFPRPISLRSRMFLNFINQRKLSLANAIIKKDKKTTSTVTILKIKNKDFNNIFLRTINRNLSSLTRIKINFILKKFFISKNQIKHQKNIQIILNSNRLLKDCFKKSKEFYLKLNIPRKNNKKKQNYKQKNLRDIKMNIGSVKANYINFKNQKTNNSPSSTDKDKDKNTMFRDFWIWAYNSTLTNPISEKCWLFLPNNTSLFFNSFFSDLGKNQKFYQSGFNKSCIPQRGYPTKQIKHVFAIARINWALYKTNYNSFTDYNKRYNLWGSQKLRNQSKNNKTKYLEKQFIDFFNKKFFLNKNLSTFYKKISNKLSQKTQKLNYLTSYSYNSIYYHSFKIKNIKNFNNFFWSNLKIKTLVKHTYDLEKQQDPFLVFTTQSNNFKYVPGGEETQSLRFHGTPTGKQRGTIETISYNLYFQPNFVNFLIISCLFLLHFCVLISLVSISQVLCFVKFHLVLVYKLSNVYTSILANISDIVKLRLSLTGKTNVLLKHKTSGFLTNTSFPKGKPKGTASKVQTNLLLLKENQNRLLTFFSFNLLRKEFKNKNKVILKLHNSFNLKSQEFAFSNNRKKSLVFISNNLIIYSKVNFISLKSDLLKSFHTPPGKHRELDSYFDKTKSLHSYGFGKTFINLEDKSMIFRKSIFLPYKIKQGILYLKKTTSLKTNSMIKFFKKTISNTCFYLIDVFQSSVRTVSNFFEKPAEYTTTWIAFGFLVEWSSDLITIMPESVDIYIWNVFSKILREKNIQFMLNSYYDYPLMGILTLNGLNTKNLYGNSNVNLNINSLPLVLTVSYLIQSRIKHFFDLLIETISQPDTDLIARQKKGTLFWDIWADFLVTTADYYNVNIAALSTIKAEQNGLIENISNDFGNLVNLEQIKKNNKIVRTGQNTNFYNLILPQTEQPESRYNKNNFKKYSLKNNIKFLNLLQGTVNKQKNFFIKEYFIDQIKDFIKKEKTKLQNSREGFFSPNIFFGKQKQRATDLLENSSSKLGVSSQQESKLESILANFNRWSINQYITYQSWHSHNGSNNANGDLFIDYHPPKSFSHISIIKYNSILQQPIGTMVCQIYSGIFNQQISKNLLLVNTSPTVKTITKQVSATNPVTDYNTLLIQALAGETELKIVTDNAQRYALVNRGFAIGIKLLRDVFDAIALNTPCIFLLEDIHKIGERRPMLISDSGGTLVDDIGDIQLDFFGSQRDEIHEKNQVVYQLTRHAITHYKKPFRGDYSLAIPTNLYLTDLFLKLPAQSTSNLSLVENHNLTIKNKIKNQNFFKFFSSLKTSYINIIRQTKKKFTPPSTSPFSVLLLKEEKKLRPNKIVEELPWTGLPGEQLSTKPRASYSVRAKVALLAELSLSNMSAKLDMITDLLVIIDSVRSNKGFVVFATTNFPHILDPALRRPGRLDETICLPDFSNHICLNYEIIKSIRLKDNQTFFTPVILPLGNKHVSMGLPITKYFKNTFSNKIYYSKYALMLNNIKKISNYEKNSFVNTPSIPQEVCQLRRTFTMQVFSLKGTKKKFKDKEIAYYEVGKELLLFYFKKLSMLFVPVRGTTRREPDSLKFKHILFDNQIFGAKDNLNLKNINKLSLYSSKHQIILQLMVVFGGKMSQLLSHKNLINTISKQAILLSFEEKTTNLVKSETSSLFEAVLSQILYSFKKECTPLKVMPISLEITPNENLNITTSMLLSILQKRYLYKKNLIVPKLLSFTDGNVLEEPPCPPFSSLLIPAKRFENYKRIFQDSLVSNKMGQRKAQISFIEKLQYQIQLIKIKELKNIFSDAQKPKKTTQNMIQHNQLNQFGNLITIPDETLVQTTTNINWFYQNRILKRHGHYLTNQWWNGQLSEHNTETIFLSDIDWRSSFIKNKQISTKNQQKNNSDGLDILLDFPDTDQYYNPRRRRWLLNKGYWSFWFNFDKIYSEEIVLTWIVESIIQTYKFLHSNTELLDFITSKFILLNYYFVKTKVVHDKTTYPKTDLMLQRNLSQSVDKNFIKAITKTEISTLKNFILTNSLQRF
uniref:Cell division protein FTSH n=1 Tax=Eudorina sp. NIES-3984 TaxID=1941220 RepID=A0A385KP75_9CHLO|nr:cell division protein FTSH [Eudorina sp. NIES-3984]